MWTSHLKRTIQTAAHIKAPVEQWHALNEIDAVSDHGYSTCSSVPFLLYVYSNRSTQFHYIDIIHTIVHEYICSNMNLCSFSVHTYVCVYSACLLTCVQYSQTSLQSHPWFLILPVIIISLLLRPIQLLHMYVWMHPRPQGMLFKGDCPCKNAVVKRFDYYTYIYTQVRIYIHTYLL